MAIDYEALFGGETYDPCAALQALRPAYMQARVEGMPSRVRFRDRDVEFKGTSVEEFASLIRELERQCAEKNGRSTGRAIQAGFRRA
jgi:gpW